MPKPRLHRVSRFLVELRRRHVTRVVGVYVVTVWVLSQGIADIFPAFGLPDWMIRYFVLAGILAIPIVALISWYFEWTPTGIIRDEGSDVSVDGKGCRTSILAHWIDRDGRKRSKRFSRNVLIGRDFDADIRFRDKRVSREHARLTTRDERWWIEDLGSSNGTFVNGEKIRAAKIEADSELRFHQNGPKVLVEVEALDDTAVSQVSQGSAADG